MLNSADFYKKAIANGYSNFIETYTGKQFFLDDPKFDIVDIAAALSKQCRFSGHTSRFYSVAEHCCIVAMIMQENDLGNPYEGLMHDAHEAYCVDLPSPWKAELPEYKAFEKRFEYPLRKWAGLPDTISDGCKKADWVALYVEAHYLIPSKAKLWLTPPPGVQELADKIVLSFNDHADYIGIDPEDAETMFLEAYAELSK